MNASNRDGMRRQVRDALDALARRVPGHAVELRVPPFAAVQLVEGPRHTRGTPGAVVEMDAGTLFALLDGTLTWDAGIHAGRIHASGERSNLSHLFPPR